MDGSGPQPEFVQVDEDIRIAQSLPPSSFVESSFARAEQNQLWRNSWVLVPPGTDLQTVKAAGSRTPIELQGAPYFLQRGGDEILRTFPNVCTHAWHTLVPSASTSKTLTCPQHGRSFDAVGHFVGQPGMRRDMPEFPRPEDSLRSLGTKTWGPLAFVHRGKASTSFEELVQPIEESLGNLPRTSLRRIPEKESIRELPGNWKTHTANYLDQTHIPYIHGAGLARKVHLDSYTTELHGDAVLQWATAKDPGLGFDPNVLPERFRGEHRVFALWWYIWPNVALNFYPWGMSVNLYEPNPTEPTKIRFHWSQFSWDEQKSKRIEDWSMEEVDAEDVAALAQVTRGLQSGEAVRGRFVPGKEEAIHWFHRRVAQAVTG